MVRDQMSRSFPKRSAVSNCIQRTDTIGAAPDHGVLSPQGKAIDMTCTAMGAGAATNIVILTSGRVLAGRPQIRPHVGHKCLHRARPTLALAGQRQRQIDRSGWIYHATLTDATAMMFSRAQRFDTALSGRRNVLRSAH